MLLNIEARIGELASEMPQVQAPRTGERGRPLPSSESKKHEKIGLTRDRMKQSETIHRNPAAVAAVIAEAKDNDDIPTKTAVPCSVVGRGETFGRVAVSQEGRIPRWRSRRHGESANKSIS